MIASPAATVLAVAVAVTVTIAAAAAVNNVKPRHTSV